MSETREYIIDKAFALFLKDSYVAVSISDISKAIGFTKGALYHHFKNKEELFKAVIDKYFIIYEIEFDKENGTFLEFSEACLANSEKTLHNIFSQTQGFEILNYLSFIADGFKHYPGFADRHMKFLLNETNKIQEILIKSIERGEIRSDIDTSLMAQSYYSIMIGMASPILQNQSIEQVIKNLKDQLDQMYLLLRKA
jgi:TetR/AcrR family transcriptional regulator, transcriptional repressor for nem operon